MANNADKIELTVSLSLLYDAFTRHCPSFGMQNIETAKLL